MGAIVQETTYDAVVYQGRVGTLKLSDERLTFHTDEKISILPWEKVVKRQVSTASSNTELHMFKLILQSGNEAIFQAQDRVSLEVMRDDLGGRLKTYRKFLKVEAAEKQQQHSAAINKTCRVSRRESTPYRFVNERQASSSSAPPKTTSRRSSMAATPSSSRQRRSSVAAAHPSSRRSSTGGMSSSRRSNGSQTSRSQYSSNTRRTV